LAKEQLSTKGGKGKKYCTVERFECIAKLYWDMSSLHREATSTGISDIKSRVDSILKNHSGVGVKAFKLNVIREDICHCDLDHWLQVVVKPGIEELGLTLTRHGNYNFPRPLLSGGNGGTLKYLSLSSCEFHPTVRTGCLRSLITLKLNSVHIMGGYRGYSPYSQ